MVERCSIYWEGVNAFRQGRSVDTCPYRMRGSSSDSGSARVRWHSGYYDARRIQKWGPNPDEEPLEVQEQCQTEEAC